jgi:hypothetical protein
VRDLTNRYMNNGYKLKQVFAEAAVHCMGD